MQFDCSNRFSEDINILFEEEEKRQCNNKPVNRNNNNTCFHRICAISENTGLVNLLRDGNYFLTMNKI